MTDIVDKEFKILMVGKAGEGKSSLINALVQSQVAPVGVIGEATTAPKRYSMPDSRIRLWDSPGFGTLPVPENKNFFSKVNFSSFDFYIVVSGTKVNEFEAKVIQRIAREGKGYLYVRTRMDQTLRNEKRAHPRTFDEATTLKKIKDSIVEAIPGASVFLVNCHDVEYMDFPRLKKEILHAPDMPRPEPVTLDEEEEEMEEEEMEEEPESCTGNEDDGYIDEENRSKGQPPGWWEWATSGWCSLM